MKEKIAIFICIILLILLLIGTTNIIIKNTNKSFKIWRNSSENNNKIITIKDYESIKKGDLRENIISKFGEPNMQLSGMYGDIYNINNIKIIVYYEQKDQKTIVTEVKFFDENI